MREFEFGQKTKEQIKIDGNVYDLIYNEKALRAVDKLEKEFNESMKGFSETENPDDVFMKIEKVSKEIVDALIGQGSFDDIFNKRGGYDVVEELELVGYLMNVIGEIQKNTGKEKIQISEDQKKRFEDSMAASMDSNMIDLNVATGRRITPFR